MDNTYERRSFGRTNIIPWPCVFGLLHSKTMWKNKDIVDNYTRMYESRISPGESEKLPESKDSGKPEPNIISSWCQEMEGHAKKRVERYCELANKTTEQLYKVATPCLDDHQFGEDEIGSVGELSTVCWQTVLKCIYLARIGRPDIS